MTSVSRAMLSCFSPGRMLWLVTVLVASGASMVATPLFAARGKAPKAAAPAAGAASSAKTNACGCYQDAAGGCLCTRKGHCGCPGQCEPKGCEEKRNRDIEREVKAETKRAQAADRKHKDGGQAKGGASDAAGKRDSKPRPKAAGASSDRP